MGKRSTDIKKAKMLMVRAQELMESPYDALIFNSRALTLLLKEETKNELLHSLINIGINMGQVGCIWAARNFFLYAFGLATNQYLKFGDIHPALRFSVNYLKRIEADMGRILYASEFHRLQMIICRICDMWPDEKESETFNYILGHRILRTNNKKLSEINGFRSYFNNLGLNLAQVAYDYFFDNYDEEILGGFAGDKSRYDDFMQKWHDHQDLLIDSEMIFWGFEDKCILRSKICGCEVEVSADQNFLAVEMGATVLASLESFFVTGLRNGVMAITPKVTINITFVYALPFEIKCNSENNHIEITCCNYEANEINEAQDILHDSLISILGHFTSIVFPFNIVHASIEEMIKNENALGRAYAFSNNLFHSAEALGTDVFSFSRVVDEDNRYDTRPKCKLLNNFDAAEEKVTWDNEIKELHYGEKPEHLNFDNVSQDSIFIDSVINLKLWDKAAWKGNAYICIPDPKYPPILTFVYTNITGKDIFAEWIKDIGNKDVEDRIKIGIIKGIRKDKPYWYRVIVGSDRVPKTGNKELILFQNINRLHTMEAESHKNVDMFLNELKKYPAFQLMPAVINPKSDFPDVLDGVSILKRSSSIVVREAYEIEKNDLFLMNAIVPDDNPILPDKNKVYPVMKVLEEKRKIEQRKPNGIW